MTLGVFALLGVVCSSAFAQVELPQNKKIFTENLDAQKKKLKADQKLILKPKNSLAPSNDVDIKAPQVEYLRETDELLAKGGVVISGQGHQIQADEARYGSKTHDAQLKGQVAVGLPEGSLSASAGRINLDSEVGTFNNAEMLVEDGNYQMAASVIEKLSEFEYELTDSTLTTCPCTSTSITGEPVSPWQLRSSHAHLTQEGYAHTYNSRLEFYGVPILYTPYLVFPVKQERASGILTPEIGYGGQDGLQAKLPIFGVIDDHTDVLLTPFVAMQTRRGASLDLRKSFSKNHSLQSEVVYSDESPRDGDLRGTVTTGLQDPTFDEQRFGVALSENWRSDSDVALPFQYINSIHYAGDDLFLRELDYPNIGRQEDTFTTSAMALRLFPTDSLSLEARGEYNQSLSTTDDDVMLQRLPELRAGYLQSFRPFGQNPLGLKLVTRGGVTSTRFSRDDGYDGWRTDVAPSLTVPMHLQNYLYGAANMTLHSTHYNLDTLTLPGNSAVSLEDGSPSRQAWQFGYSLGTGVERVYDLEPGNTLSNLMAYGSQNHGNDLVRVKHTIEPIVSYTYVPDTSQDKLPLFDELDRIRERSLVTYGIKTSLYGRFSPKYRADEEIPELTPKLEELPVFDASRPVSALGVGDEIIPTGGTVTKLRNGEVRELTTFMVRQSYDYKEDVEDNDPNRRAFSDVGASLGVYPSEYFGVRADTNFGVERSNVSSWSLAAHLKDDRDDAIRARYTYIENQISQVEGHVELRLLEWLKAGYYSRFDDQRSEFFENQMAFRINGSCNCWSLDLGYRDTLNPDKQSYLMTFTLHGLGDITQKMGLDPKQDRG